MKRILLFSISIVLSLIYVVCFCLNVSELVSEHMDNQIFYPIIAMAFSVLLSVAMLIINRFKSFDCKFFFIPLLFFVCAVITLIIGYNTPCEFCCN